MSRVRYHLFYTLAIRTIDYCPITQYVCLLLFPSAYQFASFSALLSLPLLSILFHFIDCRTD